MTKQKRTRRKKGRRVKWTNEDRERLRRELGMSLMEFNRVCRTEVYARQRVWLRTKGLYEPSVNYKLLRDERLEFIQKYARDVRQRGWYRWEKIDFNI